MRIWDNTLKKQFKKSLGTQSKNEALKIMKIEEDKFYNGKLNEKSPAQNLEKSGQKF